MKNPKNPPKELEVYAKMGTLLGVVTQLYGTRLTQLLMQFDLTVPQFFLLNHLARKGEEGQGITAIAAAVEVKQPAVSKIVAKFENWGWVTFQSNAQDARAKRVSLTPEGVEQLRTIQRSLLPEFQALLKDWSAEDISTLTSLLFRLGGALDARRDG